MTTVAAPPFRFSARLRANAASESAAAVTA